MPGMEEIYGFVGIGICRVRYRMCMCRAQRDQGHVVAGTQPHLSSVSVAQGGKNRWYCVTCNEEEKLRITGTVFVLRPAIGSYSVYIYCYMLDTGCSRCNITVTVIVIVTVDGGHEKPRHKPSPLETASSGGVSTYFRGIFMRGFHLVRIIYCSSNKALRWELF